MTADFFFRFYVVVLSPPDRCPNGLNLERRCPPFCAERKRIGVLYDENDRLVNLVAEDNAIEDTIYHLHRALNAGRIDLERFLRVCLPIPCQPSLESHLGILP